MSAIREKPIPCGFAAAQKENGSVNVQTNKTVVKCFFEIRNEISALSFVSSSRILRAA